MTSYLVKTLGGYLGASTLGRLTTDNPKARAYAYATADDAESAARMAGLERFTIESSGGASVSFLGKRPS